MSAGMTSMDGKKAVPVVKDFKSWDEAEKELRDSKWLSRFILHKTPAEFEGWIKSMKDADVETISFLRKCWNLYYHTYGRYAIFRWFGWDDVVPPAHIAEMLKDKSDQSPPANSNSAVTNTISTGEEIVHDCDIM